MGGSGLVTAEAHHNASFGPGQTRGHHNEASMLRKDTETPMLAARVLLINTSIITAALRYGLI